MNDEPLTLMVPLDTGKMSTETRFLFGVESLIHHHAPGDDIELARVIDYIHAKYGSPSLITKNIRGISQTGEID